MSRTTLARQAPTWVALLTVGWVVAMVALAWWFFSLAMKGWADGVNNLVDHDALMRQQSEATTVLAAVCVGAPLLIAVVAFAGQLRRTGVVYTVLAVLFAVVTVPVAVLTAHEAHPPAPAPTQPVVCRAYSGGSNDCPGG